MFSRKHKLASFQSLKEEIANGVTHALGAIFSLVAFIALLKGSISVGSHKLLISCFFYGFSLLALYTVSSLYHFIQNNRVKKTLQMLDHICIYLLIAGTSAPIALLTLKGTTGWLFFALECLLCIVGIGCKLIFGMRRELLSSIFYLAMGWLAIFIVKPLSLAIPLSGFRLVWMGGLAYTLGMIFFATDKKFFYFHTVWHLFVLTGSICHFIVIYRYVLPMS